MENPAEAVDAQNRTILIVDDNPANLSVVVDYLAGHDFQIMVARDGETGVQLALQDHPDLILLDVLLPGIDGFEVCRRLKADGRTRDIPVIFMTIVTKAEDKVMGFEVGGVDYITKPFQHEEVLARVTTHLRLRELTQKLEEANVSLEQRVAARTSELAQANARLEEEIAERQQVEDVLRSSEQRYHSLFENTPVSLWEEDFSQGKKYFDDLRARGVTDWRAYFESHPEAVAECASLVTILNVNQATLALLGASDKAELFRGLPQLFTPASLTVFREELITLAEGGRQFESEIVHRTLAGEERIVLLRFSLSPGYEDTLGEVIISMLDITERKQAEQALRESEEMFRGFFRRQDNFR